MLDFLMVSMRSPKKDTVEIYPKFIVKGTSKDLMIRGGDFYAIWNEETGLWSTDENTAIELIDKELKEFYEERKDVLHGENVKIMYMWDSDTGSIDKFHRYCQHQMRDHYHVLDDKIMFADVNTTRSDYASKKLSYALTPCNIDHYRHLSTTLYSAEELHKLEWAIGAIITGDAKKIQKFEVLYGAAGTGKGTMLDIIAQLFDGYYCTFEAKALGSANASFALEPFKGNPLVAIQFDGDLSKIEDNTRLNSLVSHEEMIVNEKFKSAYTSRFKCFMFMGTNKPVKITDAKSGLIRRLIDVSPTGNKIPIREYKKDIEAVKFELGGIACHCRDVYLADPDAYEGYIPVNMLGESNDFYNFIEDSYEIFSSQDFVTLRQAWSMYQEYCDDAKLPYPMSKRVFKNELKNYFKTFEERTYLEDGSRAYNCYSGFKLKMEEPQVKEKEKESPSTWLDFKEVESIFDIWAKDYPAQYASSEGTPSRKWQNVTTTLSELKTSKLHYVKLPTEHIVIDFDIPDENGNKSLEKNLEEASKWPKTYAELSKSGQGIHLHYIYTGDPTQLSNIYEEHIEVKVFNGNSSLRRKLTLCNDLPIAKISSGLPLKGDKGVTNFEGIANEKSIRTMIKRNLSKEYHPGTKPSIDFIKKILDDAYNQGVKYDVSDMRNAIVTFAAGSTHHAQDCLKVVGTMHFKSEEILDDDVIETPVIAPLAKDPTLIFYDVEVFPNLFLINWKRQGKDNPVIRMINPTPQEVEDLMNHNLVGFNCRRYDNHMLYARLMGYSNQQLFDLSQKIVGDNNKDAFFSEAYNVSYTDIYDYCSKKQSLKKWEIELGITHLELGLPWDQPVPKELWEKVAEYCDNDVISTEAVWDATQADFLAREILAELAGGTVNDTTNTLTTRLIFGNNRKPQTSFNYRFLGDKPAGKSFTYKEVEDYAAGVTDKKPEGTVWFPGYTYSEDGVSSYRGVDEVGEGGRVYANPGSYGFSETDDVTSMHPHSIMAERLFGEYTDVFEELVQARVFIKRKDFESAGKLFGGKLKKYLDDPTVAKNLAQALKIAINSVYGLTAAKFSNAFRDPRNIDNIVAKRGALFMIDLQLAVEKLGYKVIHIKTDSIKLDHPDEFIKTFVHKFGECYGYNFEVEDEWDRICLVNDAVYIGLTKDGEWKATGAEFQHPYVFKDLFTHEEITFADLCETKSVSKGAIYVERADVDTEMEFVGRVGQFLPMIEGTPGAGVLYRVFNDKKYAVTGTKGYLWMEASKVKEYHLEDHIDMSYYEKLSHDAMGHIIAFGNYQDFVDTSKPYVYEMPESGEVPVDLPEIFKR
jgi:hypothetical protein